MNLPSDRIIQDIDKWAVAIDKIIEMEGCIVPELDLRNGHRKASSRIARGGNLLPHAEQATSGGTGANMAQALWTEIKGFWTRFFRSLARPSMLPIAVKVLGRLLKTFFYA